MAGLVCMLAGGYAQAAQLGSSHFCTDRYQSSCFTELVYLAGGGERNDVRISGTRPALFNDPGASIHPRSTGCRLTSGPSGVACETAFPHPFTGVAVLAGDQDDRVDASIWLGPTGTRLIGGPGDDALTGGWRGDRLDGGPGDDALDGGPGPGDYVTYDSRTAAVRVDLAAGYATAGGERDRLSDVEDVRGGSGDDVLIGDAKGNLLIGHRGDEVLRGRGDDDELIGDGRLDGGAGDDALRFTGGRGRAACGDGRDRVRTLGPSTVVLDDCESVSLRDLRLGLMLGARDPARDRIAIDVSGLKRGDTLSARVTTLGGRVLGRTVRSIRCTAARCRKPRLRLSATGAAIVRRAAPLNVIVRADARRDRFFGGAARIRLRRP